MLSPLFPVFIFLVPFGYSNEIGPTKAQIDSATELAQCRAHCIDAFSPRFPKTNGPAVTKEKCLGDTDCWMCWDYCEMFQTNFEYLGNLCDQRTLCFDGCRLACSIYKSEIDEPNPYHRDLWSFPSAPKLEVDTIAGWLRLRWRSVVPLSAISPPLPHVLYVIFWRSDIYQPWLQLEQSLLNVYETRHGDIVISGNRAAEFLVLAVTRDGIVASGRSSIERSTTVMGMDVAPTAIVRTEDSIEEKNRKAKIQFICAIVGASLLASLLCSIGLVFLYRMVRSQHRRHALVRSNAVRFRPHNNRHRNTSANSRSALITDLNVGKLELASIESIAEELEPPVLGQSVRYSMNPRHRFDELFKGTIFESPSPTGSRFSRFSFSKGRLQVQSAFSFDI